MIKYDFDTRDGHWVITNYKDNYKMDRAQFKFSNLFGGNKELGMYHLSLKGIRIGKFSLFGWENETMWKSVYRIKLGLPSRYFKLSDDAQILNTDRKIYLRIFLS